MASPSPSPSSSSELEECFEQISPSRFVSFTFPNPLLRHHPKSNGINKNNNYSCYGYDAASSEFLRVAVLDSPLPPPPHSIPQTAAMLVPVGRHHDWIFSTVAGQLHLLLSSPSHFSRLVLIGPPLLLSSSSSSPLLPYTRPEPASQPDPDPAQALLPLLMAVSPKAAFRDGALPFVPFLSFHDDLLRIVPRQTVVGPLVGDMLVEDVAVDRSPMPPDIVRRLRFKRMPYLVQTQVRLLPSESNCDAAASFWVSALDGPCWSLRPEVGSLVQPYLQAMVAGLAVIAPALDGRVGAGLRPRSLCAGVGGGALPMALRTKLGFDVLGVEADSAVLNVATTHFGLVEDEFLRVRVGDAIEVIQGLADANASQAEAAGLIASPRLIREPFPPPPPPPPPPCMKFDAILVDLDSAAAADATGGVSAPPLELIHKNVLVAARSILHHTGVLVLNVIPPPPPPPPRGSFYRELIGALRDVFSELYELDVGNGENFVLIATASPTGTSLTYSEGAFLVQLGDFVGEELVGRITKV